MNVNTLQDLQAVNTMESGSVRTLRVPISGVLGNQEHKVVDRKCEDASSEALDVNMAPPALIR